MYTLFISEIMLIALMPSRRNVVDSHGKTSWDKAGRMEQGIQQTKDKVSDWGFYSE